MAGTEDSAFKLLVMDDTIIRMKMNANTEFSNLPGGMA